MNHQFANTLSVVFTSALIYLILLTQIAQCFKDNRWIYENVNQLTYTELSNSEIKLISALGESGHKPLHLQDIAKLQFPSFDSGKKHRRIHKNIDVKTSTSCGELTCENVENYPLAAIQRAYARTFLLNKPSGHIINSPLTKIAAPLKSVKVDIGVRFGDDGDDDDEIDENEQMDSARNAQDFPEFRPICRVREQNEYPQESVNKKLQPRYLVNIPSKLVPQGRKCLSKGCCTDQHTPEGYVFFCRPKISWTTHNVYIPEIDDIRNETVAFHDGCECHEYRKSDVEC
ncbi:uncharacterized protein LOC106653731 isoform X1 [Trichogramma pretiosum]|uniref:uncharacterized protein LOC106653731 isoform X1 n=1 Tax=Trichogramma pretiosum TaxID=7493 RepID=UPI0006C98C0D|nr:uncharacterized protein LOC106653731 isoform X1 [Trichogramma pretiosum]